MCTCAPRESRIPFRRAAGMLAAVTLLAAAACSRAPADPVARLLAELEAAAEARDADRFAAGLSEEFQSQEGGRKPQVPLLLRRYFAAYESVRLDVYGVETERRPGAARVRCVVEMSGDARTLPGLQGLLPPEAAYRFELEVVEEEGVWRVREASWQQVEPEAQDP